MEACDRIEIWGGIGGEGGGGRLQSRIGHSERLGDFY